MAGPVPRYELTDWQERYQVCAGITARGSEPGRGFDLGLWTQSPVAEVMGRWRAFRRTMDRFSGVMLGTQVHGVEVSTAEQVQGWAQVDGVDGWVTATPGVLLAVTVADCVPVYLVAPGRGVALLHAGWRGTAGGILRTGLERLAALTAASLGEIAMHCGVAICGSCYEVGAEVMTACGGAAGGSGPWQLDLRERLADQATALGLRTVSRSGWCSAHDRTAFYSHRASGGTDGRMVAYLGMPAAIDSAPGAR